MTGGQEDEEAMNKEHQFWIIERDVYRVRLDEEKRYDRMIQHLSITPARPSSSAGTWNTL